MYQVIARKYRPKRFSEVVGQREIIETLRNAILRDRVAQAYLFAGIRGTGKTTLARLFAKALNCLTLSEQCEPCGQCSNCLDIARSDALDVIEIDGASHRGIEDIRQINEAIKFAPTSGKYKIYLIDEVHMLTKEAFNALLKTLEEPPPNVKFFFATTEAHKIPPTILSRCQRFNLRRLTDLEIVDKLTLIAKELKVTVDAGALILVAKRSEGSLRDAESLFDQILAYQNSDVTEATVREVLGLPSQELFFRLDQAGPQRDYKVAFEVIDEMFLAGKNCTYFLEELIFHYRTLLLMKSGMESTLETYLPSLAVYTEEQLLMILEKLAEVEQKLKSTLSERVTLEMALLDILQSHKRLRIETLVEKLADLENRIRVDAPQARTPIQSVINDPTPSVTEIPKKKASVEKVAPLKKQPATPKPLKAAPPLVAPPPKAEEKRLPPRETSIKEQSRIDTVMRFAAKELNGNLRR